MMKLTGQYNGGNPTINGKAVSLLTWYGFVAGIITLAAVIAFGFLFAFVRGFMEIGEYLGVSGLLMMFAFMVLFAKVKTNNKTHGLLPDNIVVRVISRTITTVAVMVGLFSFIA